MCVIVDIGYGPIFNLPVKYFSIDLQKNQSFFSWNSLQLIFKSIEMPKDKTGKTREKGCGYCKKEKEKTHGLTLRVNTRGGCLYYSQDEHVTHIIRFLLVAKCFHKQRLRRKQNKKGTRKCKYVGTESQENYRVTKKHHSEEETWIN